MGGGLRGEGGVRQSREKEGGGGGGGGDSVVFVVQLQLILWRH